MAGGAPLPEGAFAGAGSGAGVVMQRMLLMITGECCSWARADQIFVLITPERLLSTPAEEYEVTAKYQVPGARLLIV